MIFFTKMIGSTSKELDNMEALWQCQECHTVKRWSYLDMINRGEPVCPYCDADMKPLIVEEEITS